MVVGEEGLDFMLTRRILNAGEVNKEQPGGSSANPSQFWKGDDSSRSRGTIYISFGGVMSDGAVLFAEKEVEPISFRASSATWNWGQPSREASSSKIFDFDLNPLGPLPQGAKILHFARGKGEGSAFQVTLTNVRAVIALEVDLFQFFRRQVQISETDSSFVWSIDRVNQRELWNAAGQRTRCISGSVATLLPHDICSFNVTFQ